MIRVNLLLLQVDGSGDLLLQLNLTCTHLLGKDLLSFIFHLVIQLRRLFLEVMVRAQWRRILILEDHALFCWREDAKALRADNLEVLG